MVLSYIEMVIVTETRKISPGIVFNHVDRCFHICVYISVITEDISVILSFGVWGYILHVQHMSCVITNCGQHQ